MYIILSMNLCSLCIFTILENSQNPPGGLFIAAKRHMHLYLFWVPEEEPPSGIFLGRQVTHGRTQFFLGFMKGLTVAVEPPRNVDPFGLDLMMLGYWGGFDRGKTWVTYGRKV